MSDYRPWDLKKPAPEPVEEPEASQTPAAAAPPKKPKEASPEDLETTKVIAAPGTVEGPKSPGEGGRVLAASALLWAGGFLFFGALVVLFISNALVGVMEADGEAADARDVRDVRGWAVPLAMLASTPAIVAGFGLMYRQPWAKPVGQIVAGLQILTVVGILPGALALGGLAAWRVR